MNKKILLPIIIIVLAILAWQLYLQLKISPENTVYCGGDWNYNVKCPTGMRCVETSNSLAGGRCQPWINPFPARLN